MLNRHASRRQRVARQAARPSEALGRRLRWLNRHLCWHRDALCCIYLLSSFLVGAAVLRQLCTSALRSRLLAPLLVAVDVLFRLDALAPQLRQQPLIELLPLALRPLHMGRKPANIDQQQSKHAVMRKASGDFGLCHAHVTCSMHMGIAHRKRRRLHVFYAMHTVATSKNTGTFWHSLAHCAHAKVRHLPGPLARPSRAEEAAQQLWWRCGKGLRQLHCRWPHNDEEASGVPCWTFSMFCYRALWSPVPKNNNVQSTYTRNSDCIASSCAWAPGKRPPSCWQQHAQQDDTACHEISTRTTTLVDSAISIRAEPKLVRPGQARPPTLHCP